MDKVAKILIGIGVTITLWVWLYESSTAFEWETPKDFFIDIIFQMVISVPWIVLLGLYIKQKNILGIVISAVLMLLLEFLAYYTTFINPEGSTAALIYVVKPFYQIIIMLVGLSIGYGIRKNSTQEINNP